VLAGFTLTNGATQTTEAPEANSVRTAGGGVWCESQSAMITNCVLVGNTAFDGGGAYSGALNNCTLTDNLAIPTFFDSSGGGAYGSTLINCTLTGNWADLGGGASDCTLTNCTLTDNSSPQAGGGGAAGSTLNSCTLTGNTGTEGGGAIYSTLNNCTLTGNGGGTGGGAAFSTLNNCTLTGNSGDPGGGAAWSTLKHCTLTGNWAVYGGGAYSSTLTNCMLTGNLAYSDFATGGGAHDSTLYNCTLAGNSARGEFGVGGGASYSTLNNCIVYYNGHNYATDNYYGSTLNYSCTSPDPGSGVANITNAPLFEDTNGWRNLRLQSNSPCINAGNNAYVTTSTDLDGNPRIVNGTVDMGAFEWQVPAQFHPFARFGTNGLALSFTGESNRVYVVHASSNLTAWFPLCLFTNFPGDAPLVDAPSPPPPARFYRAWPVP